MNILVRGSEEQTQIIKNKVGNAIEVANFNSTTNSIPDVVFDFEFTDYPENYEDYQGLENTIVLVNAVKTSLKEFSFIHGKPDFNFFGFNGLSTMVDGALLEVTAANHENASVLTNLLDKLSIEFRIVDDRVGMVTPRVICMIINEAHYTVQEGTATEEAIDLGMKLGTNYPYGPFEWCNKIGLQQVYEILEAVYEDTKEERYKIAPLLKKRYLALDIE